MSESIIIQAVYIAIGPFFMAELGSSSKDKAVNVVLNTLSASAIRGLRLEALSLIRSVGYIPRKFVCLFIDKVACRSSVTTKTNDHGLSRKSCHLSSSIPRASRKSDNSVSATVVLSEQSLPSYSNSSKLRLTVSASTPEKSRNHGCKLQPYVARTVPKTSPPPLFSIKQTWRKSGFTFLDWSLRLRRRRRSSCS